MTPVAPQPLARPATTTDDGGGKGAKGGGGTKVWTGSADGTLFCWPDTAGRGQLKESEGATILVEGGKGAGKGEDNERFEHAEGVLGRELWQGLSPIALLCIVFEGGKGAGKGLTMCGNKRIRRICRARING